MKEIWKLFYWPSLPGRGEFVRLTLEYKNIQYEDVCRNPLVGVKPLLQLLKDSNTIYAPPILQHGEIFISHTSNILQYLGQVLHFSGSSANDQRKCHSLQLSIADFTTEIHNLHHPISSSLYYEDQILEAKAATLAFFESRFVKWFSFFERVIGNQKYALGDEISYVDLGLFQIWSGMLFAFPNRMLEAKSKFPKLEAFYNRVKEDENIVDYLHSTRRIAFNEHGIFRFYQTLDM